MLTTVDCIDEIKRSSMAQTDKFAEAFGAWLTRVIDQAPISQNALAKRIGVSAATLSRWKTGRGLKEPPRIDDAIRIAQALEIPLPSFILDRLHSGLGFSEAEVVSLEPDASELADDPNISRWQIKTEALAGAGFLPGDELWFDSRIAPEKGDIVLCQIYKRKGAETAIRIWSPPFLVAAEPGRHSIQPVEVKQEDEPKAVIMGVMAHMRRNRRAHAA